MRSFFIAIFTVYFLAVASGVTVHYHYCMGKLASMDLIHARKNPCPCGEKGEMLGCCKHVVIQTKIDKALQAITADMPAAPVKPVLLAILPEVVNFSLSGKNDCSPSGTGEFERSWACLPVFLLLCNLRI